MPQPIQRVQPPLAFIPPDFNPIVLWTLHRLLPIVLRRRTAVTQVDAKQVDRLVDLYQQFQAGNVRLLLAFRHPSADDPLVLADLLSRLVPQTARQKRVNLRRPIHAHFIYDRGIPLWAGPFMGWIYSKLGGIPIHRGKLDLLSLRTARKLFVDGAFPIAVAPEGATNGHGEIVSPLEPGVAQLGFWCAEDLHKAGRSQQVFIVPIGIRYSYLTPPWNALDRLLTQLEIDTGLSTPVEEVGDLSEAGLYQRLYRLGEQLLTVMERFYTQYYHKSLPVPTSVSPIPNQEFATRLSVLLDSTLQVAEEFFALPAKGSVIDRCRRVEQAGWDFIYREDITLEGLPSLDRGLADRIAEEADLRLWHMRLVESFVAVTGNYVRETMTVERFAETALLMWDMMTRIKGGNPFKRPKLGAEAAVLEIGEPISVSDRYPAYQGNRRNAKQAIVDLTQDLQTALEKLAKR